MKEAQCQSYQMASQSLCSDLLLHRIQGVRHEGGNVMEYRTVGEGLKEKESEDESEEDDDSFNGDAYNLEEKEDVGLVKGEEGGVVHLVHGWIQQNQPQKVSD